MTKSEEVKVVYFVCVCVYMGLPKNLGNLTIKKFLTVTHSFDRFLRSSPLGHVHSYPSLFLVILCSPGSSQM